MISNNQELKQKNGCKHHLEMVKIVKFPVKNVSFFQEKTQMTFYHLNTLSHTIKLEKSI